MHKPTILVIGALGNVGREVSRALIADGISVRLADIFPDRLEQEFGGKAEIVKFDFSDTSTFRDTFKGINRMFLMRPPQISNTKRDMFPALDASVSAGVRHVAFLSLIGIEKVKFVPHYPVEEYLRQSDMSFTFLRCSFFMQNLNTAHKDEIRDRNEIFIPVGSAKTSFIDVRDIGTAAAVVLTEDGHENKIYDLTGPESLDYNQVARVLSDALGRTITYSNPSPFKFFFGNLRRGAPFAFTLVQTFLYLSTRSGMADIVTPHLSNLIRRPAIDITTYAEDYRTHWEK